MSELEVYSQLQDTAQELRKDVARMFYLSTNGHYGGCMSIAEIISCLYFNVLNLDPQKPDWADRDRFVISKGHCAATVYSALARRGFFPMSWMEHYEQLGAQLNAHPNMKKIPGCEISTGALGHGLSISVGMALGGKLKGQEYYSYCLLGDGECDEGEVWEAAMSANKFKLDHLIAIVDRNNLCVSGNTEDVMPLEPFADRWQSFGWEVAHADGHSCKELVETLDVLKQSDSGKPKVLIANTVKGKGISFMENQRKWHGGHVSFEVHQQIMAELSAQKGSIGNA